MAPGIYSTKFESADGTRRRVREMTTSHLHNLRKWFINQEAEYSYWDEEDRWIYEPVTYKGFEINEWIEVIDYELKKRNGYDPNCPLNRAMVGFSTESRELQSK